MQLINTARPTRSIICVNKGLLLVLSNIRGLLYLLQLFQHRTLQWKYLRLAQYLRQTTPVSTVVKRTTRFK